MNLVGFLRARYGVRQKKKKGKKPEGCASGCGEGREKGQKHLKTGQPHLKFSLGEEKKKRPPAPTITKHQVNMSGGKKKKKGKKPGQKRQ